MRSLFLPLPKFAGEEAAAEEEDRVADPQQGEDQPGHQGVAQGPSGEAQQEQQRGHHDHRREIGQDIEAGHRGHKMGVDLLHQDHAVGGGAGEGAEAHQEKFMLELPEALQRHQPDVDKGHHRSEDAQQDDGQNVRLDVVDLDGHHAGDDHQVEGEAGDPVHLVIVDVAPVHQLAPAQELHHGPDGHSRQGGPEEIEAPGDGIGEIGQGTQQAHEAEGQGIGQGHEAHLHGELVHGFVVGDLLLGLLGVQKPPGCLPPEGQRSPAAENVDVHHAADRRHHKANGGQGQADAAVTGELSRRGIGEVDVPAQGVAGTLAEAQGQQQAADIGDDPVALPGQQEQQQRQAQAGKCLEHIGAALECAELHHLDRVGPVAAPLGLQGHGGEADGQAVVGDDLHEPVVHHPEAEALGHHIHRQQHRAAQQRRGDQTPAEQGDRPPQGIAHHQKQQQQAKLHHKAPHRPIVRQCEVPTGNVIHIQKPPLFRLIFPLILVENTGFVNPQME